MTRNQPSLADIIEAERFTVPWSREEIRYMLFSGIPVETRGAIRPSSWKLSEVAGLCELAGIPAVPVNSQQTKQEAGT